jgi:two-component system nitrogen regulation response regulator GlnG
MLRLLQEQKFERVGGNQTISTDVRIIAATNRDLDELVEQEKFREDLLYRLKGFLICLPPLRERMDDLHLLIDHYLAVFNARMERNVTHIDPEAMEVLERYDWPGNVRELESVLKQAMINATGTVITKDCLPEVRCSESFGEGCATLDAHPAVVDLPAAELPRNDLAAFVEHRLRGGSKTLHADVTGMMERYLLTRVLHETGGNQSEAAKILGITRGSLRHKIRSLGLTINQVVTSASEGSSPMV